MDQKKLDLSHLRVWRCQCFVLIPHEKHVKGGPKHFEVIYVGYEDDHMGWRYHSTNGKYRFSCDIVFNKTVCGSLKHSRSAVLPTSIISPSTSPSSRPSRLQKLTDRGCEWADAICIHNEHYQRL